MRPGGLELTKKAFDICKLPKAAKVLDIGCGYGDTAAFLESEYGFSVTGMDTSAEVLLKAREKHPGINFVEGDGQWLDFDSLSFECVLMECVLSLMSNPVEAIHEAYCALKKGGYLIIHDLYLPHPSNDDFKALEQIRKAKLEHAREVRDDHYDAQHPDECSSCQMDKDSCVESCQVSQHQHVESPCPDEHLSPCTVDGALVMDEIYASLNELELEKILFEDRKADLDSYVASAIFSGRDLSDCYNKRKGKSKMSYFLIVARKV